MKKVLLIGANSYIGQEFKRFLCNNIVDSIDLTLVSASNGEWEQTDFSQFDTIMHASALVHKKEKKSMELEYHNINYKLTLAIAQKARDNNITQFIFFSTAAVFDTRIERVTKASVPKPSSLYGKSKLAAEDAIRKMNSPTFQVAIVRIPMVYGDGCKGNYQKLVKLAKYIPVFPELHNKRSVVHINKLCEFLADLIISKESGYFYPQDENYMDTCETIVKLREVMGKKTYLTNKFNFFIRILLPYSNVLSKMFSDFYYDMD